MTKIKSIIQASINIKTLMLESDSTIGAIEQSVEIILKAFKSGNKILFCGNGGSAADAQHLAAELCGRFYKDRIALPAEALHVNSSYLTAVANDYSFDVVYSRLLEGIGKQGDVLVGISTSGRSKNVMNAFITAKEKGMSTIALTGKAGQSNSEYCDVVIKVPSEDTPRVQECHILVGHIICQLVEEAYFV